MQIKQEQGLLDNCVLTAKSKQMEIDRLKAELEEMTGNFKFEMENRDVWKQKAEAEKQRADGNFKSYERVKDNYSQMSSKAERLAGALRKIGCQDFQECQESDYRQHPKHCSEGIAKAALDEFYKEKP